MNQSHIKVATGDKDKRLVVGDILNLAIQRLKEYGPSSLAIGASLAGISHYMSQQEDTEEEKKRKLEEDSVYVTVKGDEKGKEKRAADWSQYVLDGALISGASMGGMAVGYGAINEILKRLRGNAAKIEVEKAKKEYAKLLAQRIEEEGAKTASEYLDFPNIESLCYAISIGSLISGGQDKTAKEGDNYKAGPTDPTMATMLLSFPALTALLTGVVSHSYWYNKNKNIEDSAIAKEKEEARKTPVKIKLRSEDDLRERLEEEREENKKRKELEQQTYDYGDQPQPRDMDQQLIKSSQEKGKEDDAEDYIDIGALNEIESEIRRDILKEVRTKSDSDSSTQKHRGEKRDRILDPKKDIETIDKNTSVIHTNDGDTVVESTGPASSRKLNKAKKIIAKALSMVSNIEE